MAASLPPASGLPRGEVPTGCIRHTRPELLAKLTLHRKPRLTGTAVDPLGEPWRRHINKAKKPCACLAVLPFPLLAFWMQAPQRRSQRHTASYSCCGQQYGVISKQVPTGQDWQLSVYLVAAPEPQSGSGLSHSNIWVGETAIPHSP